jgi:flagellar assembly protein FliH
MILRSRAVAGQAVALANPGVETALRGWESRVAAARAEGRAEAEAEAKARIAAAEERAAQAEAKARAKASAEAEARIQAESAALHARLDGGLAALAAAEERLAGLEKSLVAGSRAALADLAVGIAERILAREVETDPEWMDALLAEALARIPDKRAVVVRLHPDDAATVRARIPAIAGDIPGLERVVVEDDAGLRIGDLVLRSQGTRLDAGLRGALERVARRLAAEAPAVAPEAGPEPRP